MSLEKCYNCGKIFLYDKDRKDDGTCCTDKCYDEYLKFIEEETKELAEYWKKEK